MPSSGGLLPAVVTESRERYLSLANQLRVSHTASGPPGVDRPLIQQLGELGFLRQMFGSPESPASALDLCTMREAIAQVSTGAETAAALQGLGGLPLARHGSTEVRQMWLPALTDGAAVAAFALTEPQAGSDAAAIELVANRRPGGWRLNGLKKWISNAPDADVYLVFARTTAGTGSRGITAFAVPGDVAGLAGRRIDMISRHPIGELSFEDVDVSDEQVVGTVDGGFQVAMDTLDRFRPSVGAASVGMSQAALDAAVTHVQERHAFGRQLAEFQAIRHRLADATTRLEAARLLVYHAAAAYDNGSPETRRLAAMAKLLATETGQWVIDAALQFFGASGLESGHLLEELYRDIRPMRIYEGASEIQREIIARQMFR